MDGCVNRNIIDDGYKVILSKLIAYLKQQLLAMETAIEEGTLIDHIKKHNITATDYRVDGTHVNQTLKIILHIQSHANYKQEYEKWVENMYYIRRQAVYTLGGEPKKMTPYALGTLTAFILPQEKENMFLNRKNNLRVMSRDRATLEGRGETFHPKLEPSDVQTISYYGIDIYRELNLITPDALDKRIREILRITN